MDLWTVQSYKRDCRYKSRAQDHLYPLGLVHTRCNKWHIHTTNGRKTENIIIGAVICLLPFSKSIREHHTLKKGS